MNKLNIYQPSKTLNNYVNWLQNRSLTSKTVQIYTEAINHFENSFGNSLTLTNLTNFFQAKVQKLAANTIISRQTALKSYAKFQKLRIDWTRISKLIPKVQRKFFNTIDFADLEKLKQTAITSSKELHERNSLILDFLLFSGLRLNELANIRHGDWTGNSLQILGKGNKIRQVLLPEFLSKHFNPNSQKYLFTNQSGQQLSKRTIQKIIREKVKKSGINKVITTHSFRRSFATLLNKEGTHLTTIQKLLGHSHITTTANYIHDDYQTLYDDYSKLWKNNPNFNTYETN